MRVPTGVLNCAVVATLGLDLVRLMDVVAHEPIGQAVVNQISLLVTFEHEIGAFDVAVGVAARMDVLQGPHDLAHETQHAHC